MTVDEVLRWYGPRVSRYLVLVADMAHPRVGWYVQVGGGLPIGPFPDLGRADLAVEAIEAVIAMQSREGSAG